VRQAREGLQLEVRDGRGDGRLVVKLKEHHWLPALLAKLSLGAVSVEAVTIRRSIYFKGKVIDWMIPHEVEHVRQQHRLGMVRFLAAYWWEFARGLLSGKGLLNAYRDISFEREARRANPYEKEE
jgi:hypothetical protein